MGNKSMIGIGLALLLLVVAVGLRYMGGGASVIDVESDHADHDHDHPPGEHHLHPTKPGVAKDSHHDHDHNVAHDHHHGHDHDNQTASTGDQPSHLDMLTPEMKQAIKDKLLLHGPMEVIRHPDGRIELPTNGRFTQMPVAVQMPDGSIVIKEYSQLPD